MFVGFALVGARVMPGARARPHAGYDGAAVLAVFGIVCLAATLFFTTGLVAL